MKRLTFSKLALISAAFAACQVASAAPLHEVIQMGNRPGFENGLPMAINNKNFVVGNSYTNTINSPWLFSEATGLQGLGFDGFHEFYMRDINSSQRMSGFSKGWQSAVRGQAGSMSEWGDLNGYAKTEAWGLNDAGAMVGWATTANALERATRFNVNFTHTLLPVLDISKNSRARRVNYAGFAVGSSDDKAVLWTANNTLVNLHAMLPGAVKSFATDINEAGWVTGYVQNGSGASKGFRFNFETGISLFDPIEEDEYVVPRAINLHGNTVGMTRRTEFAGQVEAFINMGGVNSISLNSLIDANSGWFLSEAMDINDNGYIVGRGTFQGIDTTYMLKPVPEPASIMAIGVGLGYLSRRTRPRQSRLDARSAK